MGLFDQAFCLTAATTGVGDVFSTSRWGIKGTSEVSEGLTAVYNFESKINTTNASHGLAVVCPM